MLMMLDVERRWDWYLDLFVEAKLRAAHLKTRVALRPDARVDKVLEMFRLDYFDVGGSMWILKTT